MLLPLMLACGLDPVSDKDALDTAEVVSYGDLSLSPANLDFGYVPVGSSGQQSLVIANSGDAAVNLSAVTLDSDAFVVAEAAAMPVEIGPGVDVTLTVDFTPDVEGSFAGTLSLDTDAEGIIDVAVAGTSIEGEDTGNTNTGAYMEVSRKSISFGEIDVGKTLEETVVLENTGTEDVLIVNVTSDSNIFGWDKSLTLPYVLPAGQTRDVGITFSPLDEQTYSGTVTIASDAENEQETAIAVDGKGFHGCTICAPQISVKYNSQAVYTVTDFFSLLGSDDTKELQIWNEGDEPLEVTDVSITNDDSLWTCQFSVTGFNGSTWSIDPWSYNAINVTFSGSTLCLADAGQVTITSNDPYESTYTVDLQGISLTQ
jgi:large repetitive protein